MVSYTNYKMLSAIAALKYISRDQIIGLGAGTTIAHLIGLIAADKQLASSLVITSSSFKTTQLLKEQGFTIQPPQYLNKIDIYFDGCDQFDTELNALKSGGGIHTTEKILAAMASEFILIGDAEKFVLQLGTKYPLVVEVLPAALQSVLSTLKTTFPDAEIRLRMSSQKDGALVSENGNFLADIHFSLLPPLAELNSSVKMIPGIVDHSLFYKMATKAIIAGPEGTKTITSDPNPTM